MVVSTFFLTFAVEINKTIRIMAKFNSVKDIITNKEFLTNWLSTATYGSPWFAFGVHIDTKKEVYTLAKFKNECREDIWADVLLNGGYFLVEDVEEEKDYKISLEDIENGFNKFMLQCPSQYAALMDDTADLYDADALMQVIVFGEVTYG